MVLARMKLARRREAGYDYLVAFAGNLCHIADIDLSFRSKSQLGIYGLGTGRSVSGLGYLAGLFSSVSLKEKNHELTRPESR
jgi:hypothetical protein